MYSNNLVLTHYNELITSLGLRNNFDFKTLTLTWIINSNKIIDVFPVRTWHLLWLLIVESTFWNKLEQHFGIIKFLCILVIYFPEA